MLALAFLAIAFLAIVAASSRPTRLTDPNSPARSHTPIDLTVAEIRHLLSAWLTPPNTTPTTLLRWSHWRRRHQATTRRSHYQRRLAEASST
jgi:hypothetical protein